MLEKHALICNGVDYTYKVDREGGYIEVWDSDGLLADGKLDDAFETFCYNYSDPADPGMEIGDCCSALYFAHDGEFSDLAVWLINTHPANN